MSEQWLPSEHGGDTGALQQRVARGLTWTLIDTWGTQLLGLLIFVILARLLNEFDFGLVALAAVFVAFAQLFVDQGLGDALIQRKALTRGQIDTAFWVAVVTGSLMTLFGIVLAGPLATVLGKPAIAPILQVLSLSFVLAAFSSIQVALMRREMRFRSLAIRKLVAVAGGGAVGVVMAFGGSGAWALVGQQLSGAAIAVLALWTVSPWRPGLRVSRADFRDLFTYGVNVVGSDLLNFLSRNVDRLLIGAYLGEGPLGFYAVGFRILDTSQSMLVNFARKLAFPIFSRLQGEPERLRRAYARVSRSLSIVMLPGYIGLSLVAPEAIVAIFGGKWAASGPVASILFLIGPVLTVQLFTGALLNSVGHPEVTFRIRLVTTIVNVSGFFVAVFVFRDIVFVAGAFVLRAYLLLPLIMWWVQKYAGIRVLEQLGQLRTPVIATALMAAAVLGVKVVLVGAVHGAVLLAAEVAVGVVVFFAALLALDRELLRDVATIAFQALPGGGRIARRVGLRLPAAETEHGPARRAAAPLEAGAAQEAAAEELATEGGSVAAERLTAVGGASMDESLGDV
jgi:PST family polysaccharide transporter